MRWIYRFGPRGADGNAEMRDLLGGKGANLAEMSRIGLPVPPGFTLSTELCTAFSGSDGNAPDGFVQELKEALSWLEGETQNRFGSADAPLLVSVRSGARESMPGMMDTVLNLGLNDTTTEGLARASGNPRFAWDCYRRFVQMFADVVLGVKHTHLEAALSRCKDSAGVESDAELEEEDLRTLVATLKGIVATEAHQAFPEDPFEQLHLAIRAVFDSWMNDRAIKYRSLYNISAEWGTAVTIQAMVFGNRGPDSATGVVFTRNPATGENKLYGEYLINAQGEDVVAGLRTPLGPSEQMAANKAWKSGCQLPMRNSSALPPCSNSIIATCRILNSRSSKDSFICYKPVRGKRTAAASVRIAVEMATAGLIDRDQALLMVDPHALEQLLHPMLDPAAPRRVLARGLPASPGAVSGRIVLDAAEAERESALGHEVILVRSETSPEDIHGMAAAVGILTAHGGMTSHAAVVARGMGRPCVVGSSGLNIDLENRIVTARLGESGTDFALAPGMVITIDGTTGEIIKGEVPCLPPSLSGEFTTLMEWADQTRRLGVRANAETPRDTETARAFGAEGIGLARTEHMFFDANRIAAMREMIMAEDEAGRRAALDKLLPAQRADFIELFRIMEDRPVTIRLLDPPLHEFLPHLDEDLDAHMRRRRTNLTETNPMLGHRGCRLAITYPEICEMQARAIIEAMIEIERTTGQQPNAEIMIPLALSRREIDLLALIIHRTADSIALHEHIRPTFSIGTMIELPRACLKADEIARSADFFSFGTNDLTQTTLGVSRDDAGSFLDTYRQHDILPFDPFVHIDEEGVGALMRIAIERGKNVNPALKLGICGEHGGDPASIAFCEEIGLDYVSASPYRVPVARLAAAQARLRKRKTAKAKQQKQ